MSRAYRIGVSESTRKHVRVDDGIATQLELLPVLGADAMAELLARELGGLGFVRDGDAMKKTVEVAGEGDSGPAAVAVEIDLRTGTVTARLGLEAEVAAEVNLTRTTDRARADEERAALRVEAQAALDAKIEDGRRALTGEVTARLERALRDLRGELDRATNRVAAEALKTRARQLGEVQEISENPETGELVIRVRV